MNEFIHSDWKKKKNDNIKFKEFYKTFLNTYIIFKFMESNGFQRLITSM